MTTTFPLPADVELSVELDDATPSIYIEQGTDIVQVHPKHVGTLCRALYAAELEWRKHQPVRVSQSPLYRDPATTTKGEA